MRRSFRPSVRISCSSTTVRCSHFTRSLIGTLRNFSKGQPRHRSQPVIIGTRPVSTDHTVPSLATCSRLIQLQYKSPPSFISSAIASHHPSTWGHTVISDNLRRDRATTNDIGRRARPTPRLGTCRGRAGTCPIGLGMMALPATFQLANTASRSLVISLWRYLWTGLNSVGWW